MTNHKQVKPRLKARLLMGKTITQNQALKLWGTSRLAVYVNRLRNDGMDIHTEMVNFRGDTFAKYSLKPSK